jgi:hypothetical protein
MLLTLSVRQLACLKSEADARGVNVNELIRQALAKEIGTFPLDLLAQGEANQPVNIIVEARRAPDGTVNCEQADGVPTEYFRRLYAAPIRAALYLVGEWTNPVADRWQARAQRVPDGTADESVTVQAVLKLLQHGWDEDAPAPYFEPWDDLGEVRSFS